MAVTHPVLVISVGSSPTRYTSFMEDSVNYENFDLQGEAHKKADEEIRQAIADALLKILYSARSTEGPLPD